MKELGTLFRPEQYAKPDEKCVLEDSVIAYDFFKDFHGPGGIVFLATVELTNLQVHFLPVWLYFLPKTERIISISPVFKVDKPGFFDDHKIFQPKVVDDETYFYWNCRLHAATFTSTGEMAIRGVRCILNAKDMQFIAELDDNANIEDIYPVRLYCESTGKFLGVCWALETESAFWYESVCSDDDHFMDKVDVHDTCSYPINIGEMVIIGGDYYFCRYEKDGGTCFVKTNFKASEQDRERENLVVPPQEPKPFVPKLKIAHNAHDVIKKKEDSRGKIVKLTPKI